MPQMTQAEVKLWRQRQREWTAATSDLYLMDAGGNRLLQEQLFAAARGLVQANQYLDKIILAMSATEATE